MAFMVTALYYLNVVFETKKRNSFIDDNKCSHVTKKYKLQEYKT